MIELFRAWLLGIVASALILSVVYALVPQGKFRSIARFTGGLVLLLAVMGPMDSFSVDGIPSYRITDQQIQQQIEEYRRINQSKTEAIIVERIAAYIADIGRELGVDCHPSVTTYINDGVPFPYAVTMDIPRNDTLSERIFTELGIPPERQRWRER